jgi:hypothetical protein
MKDWIPIGDGHAICYYAWKPDRALNPQYGAWPDTDRAGCFVAHILRPDDSEAWCREIGYCLGSIVFDGQMPADGHAAWQVQSWEPLTVAPSLACHCGDHGFIQNGRWVRA